MTEDKFEQKLMTRLSKGNRIDTTSYVLTEILSDYRAFKAEKPTEGLVEELLKIESELDSCATRPLSDHTLNILCTVMGRLHSLISRHAHDKEGK